MLNYYSIPPIISGILIFIIGSIIFIKGLNDKFVKRFYLICLVTTIWLFGYGANYSLTNPIISNSIFRFCYIGVILIPVTVFNFVSTYTSYRWTKYVNLLNLILASICTFLIIYTDLFINGVRLYYWGYYPVVGKLHIYFLIYFFGVLSASILIMLKYFVNPAQKYLFYGFSIFCVACLDFLPNYGYEIYPIGYIPAFIFILIVAYAVIRHKLLNIVFVIKKGLLYSIITTVITLTYLLIIFISEQYLKVYAGYTSLFASLFCALIIALFFIPLRNILQTLLDKLFFNASRLDIAEENILLRKQVTQSDKLKAVATLASGMAHEIKNPLTAIKTFTEYLPSKKNDKEFLNKFSNIVGKEVARIDDLVHQLLDFAKPSPLKLKETDIHNLIDNTLEFLNNQLVKNNIKVNKSYTSAEPLYLQIDPIQFKQAILNIFLNAIEAIPNGGELSITTSKDQSHTAIHIKDTGIGINKNDLEHIFDPFFTKKDGGTGLGLSITHQILTEHNAKIHVKSQPNKGTQFLVTLPIAN